MNGGFPPIKKNKKKNIKKKVKTGTDKKDEKVKKLRFASTDYENIDIKDILSIVKKKKEKKESQNLIDELLQIETVENI